MPRQPNFNLIFNLTFVNYDFFFQIINSVTSLLEPTQDDLVGWFEWGNDPNSNEPNFLFLLPTLTINKIGSNSQIN